jgi:ABC-type multidrug transport system fused ATPase/permease subunit
MFLKLQLLIKRWNFYRKLISLRFRSVFILLIMSLFATFSEAVGLGIFYPIFEFIKADSDINTLVENSELWIYIIDLYSFFGFTVSLVSLLIVAFSLFLSRQTFLYLRAIYQIRLSSNLNKILRNSMFNKYLLADSDYQDSLPIGDFAEVISRETNNSVSGILTFFTIIADFITIAIFLSILLLISWHMTIIACIVLFITSLAPKIWIEKSVQAGRNLVNSHIKLSTFLIDRLKSPRLVRLSGVEVAENEEFSLITQKLKENMIYKAVLKNKTDMIMEPIVILLSLIFLYFSVERLGMQLGEVGVYLIVSLRLLPLVKGLMLKIQVIKSAAGSIEIVDTITQNMLDAQEIDTGKKVITSLKKSIKFESVYFDYSGIEKSILKEISFEIPANKMTAIVGPSGSGKSTLIDLLPRLRDIKKGNIFFDDFLIQDLKINSLRNLISYTYQNPQTFNVTVQDHIRYGKPDANIDEIKYAASLSGIAEFIETLPLGYDTMLGEGATRVSGGQMQRLDLARAIIRQASVLILDEPTSNLDANSEEQFNNSLVKILDKTNATIIIVSHKLRAVMNSEKIIVLNKGKVEAVGNHDDLLKSSNWYKKAWKIQNKIA